MDEAYVKRLLEWAANAPIREIELVDGDFRIHLVKGPAAAAKAPPLAQPSADLVVTAPLPGVFYLHATPDAPAFVAIGQVIKAGDTVGLIEAMKMFNPIVSEFDGVIDALLVQSGQEVAAGQPVLMLRPSEDAPG